MKFHIYTNPISSLGKMISMRFKNLVSSKLLSIVTCLDVDFSCHSRIGLRLGQVGTDSDPGLCAVT